MDIRQTVSNCLKKQVSLEDAIDFAVLQFGTLAAYLRDGWIDKSKIVLVTEVIDGIPIPSKLFTDIKKASEFFLQCVRENTDIGENDSYYESFLEDGILRNGNEYTVTIRIPEIQ